MAKKGKKSRRHRNRNGNMTLPLGIIAGFAPGAMRMWNNRGSMGSLAHEAGAIYLGYNTYDGTFQPDYMKFGTLPIVLGFLVHWLAGEKFGINRMLSRAKVPILRI